MIKILVVDGMGGSIGHQIVTKLRQALAEEIEILALGTNSVAVSNMMKAGANRGASGENAFKRVVPEADIVIGPVSIVIPHSFMGELTPVMAECLAISRAQKVLLPLSHPHIDLVGASKMPLPHLMDEAVKLLKALIKAKEVKENV
jgi:hypothetical protein